MTHIVTSKACRLDKTRLYEFADPLTGAYMPADVMADLEAYCGRPIYSQALVENRPCAASPGTLLVEAMDHIQDSAAFMSFVRKATEDGHLSSAERRGAHTFLDQLEEHVRAARAAVDGAVTS